MTGRGAILSIIAVVTLVAGGGAALQQAGVRSPAAERTGTVPSGAWFCPHGGGSSWSAWLSLANPGERPVRARVASFGRERPTTLRALVVPAGSVERIGVPAGERGAATMVQYFGGWIAAGWVTKGGGGERGDAAEPCLPEAGRSWVLPDGTTEKGQDAYAVVMNPFASEAVFSVTLVTERRTVRAKEWTNFVLPAGRSTAFHLNDNALGEQTVAAQIDVSIGRVAAASLGIASAGGIRSSVGSRRPESEIILPGASDAGPSALPVIDPGKAGARYSVTILGGSGPRPAPDLVGQQLGPGSDRTEHVSASGVAVVVRASHPIAAARRSSGPQGDQGSTSGAPGAVSAWVIPSPAALADDQVRLYLTNPGRTAARVELFVVSPGRSRPSRTRTVEVAGGTTQQVTTDLGPADSSVVAVSTDGTFVPALASYATRGLGYAVTTGVPIPAQWVPRVP